MKVYKIKLAPLSPFQSIPKSDTLFGAICWGIKRLYNESKLIDILDDFQENPKFILSSSFPYLECNENHILFYPKTIASGLLISDIETMSEKKKDKVEVVTQYKKFKKAEYVSLSIFEKMLNGFSEKDLFQEYYRKDIELEGNLIMIKKEHTDFFQTSIPKLKNELVQKNAIDRLTMSTGEEGQTFYQEEYYSSSTFKLHFLLKTDEIDFLKPVFRYLEDEGIGGNRSTGKGRFKIDIIGEMTLPDINNSKTFVSLSRFIPFGTEINLLSKTNCYEIFPCRSKVDSEAEFKGEDIWKARVMYLKEGSCLEAIERKEFYGRVPVVKEIKRNKIYQNGLAFPVFGKFGETQ